MIWEIFATETNETSTTSTFERHGAKLVIKSKESWKKRFFIKYNIKKLIIISLAIDDKVISKEIISGEDLRYTYYEGTSFMIGNLLINVDDYITQRLKTYDRNNKLG